MGSANPTWRSRAGVDLLHRYDVAGPRYTSYPIMTQFRPDFGESEYREHARRSNATFAPQARIAVLLVGLSGFYMSFRLDLWRGFTQLRFWWLDAMVLFF